jgi:peroxiredoxin
MLPYTYHVSRACKAIPLLLAAALALGPAVAAGDRPARLRIGDELPDLTLPRLGGGKLRLRELRGRVVALTFYSPECAPCRKELPVLLHLVDRINRDLPPAGRIVVVVVSIDDPGRDRLVKESPGAIWLVDDDEAARTAFEPRTLPCTYLADPALVVRHINRGFGAGYEARVTRWLRALVRDRTRN